MWFDLITTQMQSLSMWNLSEPRLW